MSFSILSIDPINVNENNTELTITLEVNSTPMIISGEYPFITKFKTYTDDSGQKLELPVYDATNHPVLDVKQYVYTTSILNSNGDPIINGDPGSSKVYPIQVKIEFIYSKNGTTPTSPPYLITSTNQVNITVDYIPTPTPSSSSIITYENVNQLSTDRVYVIQVTNTTNDDYSMMFPASNTSDTSGAPIKTATSSEAFWYFIDPAIENNNIPGLQKLLNGYLYSTQAKYRLILPTLTSVNYTK